MTAATTPAQNTGTYVQSLFVDLIRNLTDKEREVLVSRIGLYDERQTLQAIGDRYDITRERVRQIEDVGIKKLGRIVKGTFLEQIQAAGESVLRISGGLLRRDRLVSAVIDALAISGPLNESIVEVLLQSDFNIEKNKPQLGVSTYFYLPEINRKLIAEVHREAVRMLGKKGDVMERTALYDAVRSAVSATYGQVGIPLIDSILDVYHDIVKGEEKFIGLAKWKILNPATLKDKAIYIFKKEKRPFHFVELANAIGQRFGGAVKVPTIHNELIRNNEFVLIGRGIYVLKEWGYKTGTVLDVIMDILNRDPRPHTTDEIIAKVLKTRQVKPSTIYMNLQNKRHIERVGRNMYQLRSA